MKNVFLVLGLVLLLGAALSAQEATTGITGKGVKLGIGFADLSTDYDELNEIVDSRTGFSGGAFLTYAISRQVAIQPELLYVSKGAGKDIFFFDFHWNLDYIEVPVLLKVNLAPDAKLRPNLFAGPALDLLMSSKFHALNESIDIKDYTKGMDFSFVFGGGLEFKHVTFDVRYTLGLTNVVDAADKINEATEAEPGDWYYLEGDPSVKNTDIQFMLGVKF